MSHEELLARHRKVLPDWLALNYEQPIALERGEGRYVWDTEGNRYLDFFAGILTTMSGHAVPEIVDTIKSQADKMLHSSTLYLIEPAIELAERIAELAPVDDGKVFFTSSGSEANETALLLSAAYRRSNQVLALRNSYHGRSFATVAITGNRGWSPSALTPVNVSYVHGGYKLRSPWRDHSDEAFIGECVDDLRSVIDTMTSGDVACLIAEPIQGVGGFATPPDGLFGAMHKVLDEHGILLISDEVQTGWGRTGEHFWGIDAHGVRPDMITFAKGLGNGLSIGGVVARRRDHGLLCRPTRFRRLAGIHCRQRGPSLTLITCSTTISRPTAKRGASASWVAFVLLLMTATMWLRRGGRGSCSASSS